MTEKITFVEIDLDRCSNTYGVAPCTASVGVTGSDKCYNCLASCQDQANYASETVTARYSTATSKPPRNIDAIPMLSSVSLRPAKLDLGESIGIRASIDLSFVDARFPDTGPEGDYYRAERNYDPYTQGSYWGKFRARFPYTKGTDVRLIRGDTDQTLAQMETRHFVFEKIAGPDSSGNVTIQCKDALKLAEGKKAQAPTLTPAALAFDILAGDSNFTVAPSDYLFAVDDYVNIGGDEICKITGVVGDGSNGNPYNYTITRGEFNTTAKDHAEGDRVQKCIYYFQQKAPAIIADLLENYANIPASYIPIADWISESDTYINRVYTALIAEPESVTGLINEILQQTASALWWDDINRLLRFRVLRAVDSDAATYTDDLIKAGSFSAKDQPEKRVSQVWTYYGRIDPTKKLDETSNYSSSLLTVSTESETNYKESSIKRIFSRWIPLAGGDAADRLNKLILSRYTNPPRLISFNLQKGTLQVNPSLGGGYNVKNHTIQDFSGAQLVRPIQTVQVKSTDTEYQVLAEEVLYTDTVGPDDPNVKNLPVDNDSTNVNLYTRFTEAFGTPQSTDIVNLIISTDVIIGSTSTGTPAITTGTGWPAGITLNIINNGFIVGRGGQGGSGGDALVGNPQNGANGLNGGDAIHAFYELNITNNNTIGGGGGGGGGGGALYSQPANDEKRERICGGGGGGSGAGYLTTIGGLGGTAATSGNNIPVPLYDDGDNGEGSTTTAGGLGGQGGSVQDSISWRGGDGGDGGGLGQFGAVGSADNQGQTTGGTGGLAGAAIITNGNTINLTGNAVLGNTV